MKKFRFIHSSLIISLLICHLLCPQVLFAHDMISENNASLDNKPLQYIDATNNVTTSPVVKATNDQVPDAQLPQNIGGFKGIYGPQITVPKENNKEIGEIISPTVEQFVLPTGCDLANELSSKLPTHVSGVIAQSRWVLLPVSWNMDIDTQNPGLINIIGSVDLGEYTTCLEDTSVSIPVMLYNETSSDMDTITKITYDNTVQLLAVGKPVTSLSNLFKTYNCQSINDKRYVCTIDWDFSTLDTSKVGMQEIYGKPHLPSCLTIDEACQTISQPIYVAPTDEVTLSAATFDGYIIICRWIYELPSTESANCYYSKDGKVWEELSKSDYSLYPNELHIDAYFLDIEEYPYFYLAYDNKKSNILHASTIKNGTQLKFDTIDSSRDGSKYEGQSLPHYDTQADNSSSVTNQSTTITGDYLETLTTINPDSVFFEKQGIVVSISSDFLNALGLLKEDLLTVILDKVNDESFTFDLLVNDKEVTALPNMEVQLPVITDDPTKLAIVHEGTPEIVAYTPQTLDNAAITKASTDTSYPKNNVIHADSYDDDFDTATFTISKPGTYTLSHENKAIEDNHTTDFSLPAAKDQSPKTPSGKDSHTITMINQTDMMPLVADPLSTDTQKSSKPIIGILAAFALFTSLLGIILKYRRGVHHE